MKKEELMGLINKLFYRIKDLESEKNCIVKNIEKKNEKELSKYQKLLVDVKEAREKNRLNFSAF